MPKPDPLKIDYHKIKPPEDKDPGDYHYTERRAEILRLMRQAGSPYFAEQKDLAKRYGVKQQQISEDFELLRRFILKTSENEVKERTAIFYDHAIEEMIDQGDIKEARQLMREWNEWLFRIGAQEEAPKKIEHSGRMELDVLRERLRDSYEEGDE